MIGKELFPKLFEPGQIGKVRLRNRIIWLPIAGYFCGVNSDVTDRSIANFVERAKGGVGLIAVGITNVTPIDEPITKKYFTLGEDRLLQGHYHLTEAVHLRGAKIGIQLNHVGGIASVADYGGKALLSPSGIQQFFLDGAPFGLPRPMTRNEIYQMIEYFVAAGNKAKKAGYDVVELHAGHGYLLSAFLSPALNKRTDEFGGNVENRARIVVEIIKGIHQLAGDDCPVSVRINAEDLIPGGMTIRESQTTAKLLEQAGAAIISVSSGMYESEIEMDGAMNFDEGWKLPLWTAIKKAVTIPTIAGGGNRTPEFCEKLLAEGHADFVGLGRPLVADPYWPWKVMEGRIEDINNCVRCMRCMFAIGGGLQYVRHCTVNAMWGREVEYVDRKLTATKKKVMIVGGGVAGMEAGRVASLRGHEVTVYEKERELGGQLSIASVCTFLGKDKLLWVQDYLITQLKKQGVRIEVGSEVAPDTVSRVKPDVVIIATGAQPLVPGIPGIESTKVITAWDVLGSKQKITNQTVVVLGGNVIGCETACFLARQGNKVIIVKRRQTIAEDIEPVNRQVLLNELEAQNVKVLTGLRVVEITSSGVGVVNIVSGENHSIEADRVVLAMGETPVRGLAEVLEGKVAELYVIGDCQEPRTILEAIGDGFLVGNTI